jgi:hypothetical protein
VVLCLGWARRPPNGKMYGAKYIHSFRDQVRVLFSQGERTSGEKLSAGRMRELLRNQNRGRFDLPSEGELHAEISRLFAMAKKRAREGGDNEQTITIKRFKMQSEHSNFLENLVLADFEVKPVAALTLFRAQFPDADTLLNDQQVRSKVSVLKRKIKQ